jgi:ABC-2 type transport system ATP-binding protein
VNSVMTTVNLTDVSKFYGDVLGVNRLTLTLEPGITGLVGPNGAGKSTLMNLIAGLMRPNRGSIDVLGITPSQAEVFYRLVGYCTQYDSFPAGMTGRQFVQSTLQVHGYPRSTAVVLAQRALERVDLVEAAGRRIEGYSKGMRQRIKLAQAICHEPQVLVLDEPLNGLDPMARAQVIDLFREFAATGAHVIISSHILHEVDLLSDHLVMLDNGYLVAQGDAPGIQGETGEPMQIFIRSSSAAEIASRLIGLEHVVEVQLHQDGEGLFVRTADADQFFLAFNEQVLTEGWAIDAISPADETVEAVYRHLIVQEQVAT